MLQGCDLLNPSDPYLPPPTTRVWSGYGTSAALISTLPLATYREVKKASTMVEVEGGG